MNDKLGSHPNAPSPRPDLGWLCHFRPAAGLPPTGAEGEGCRAQGHCARCQLLSLCVWCQSGEIAGKGLFFHFAGSPGVAGGQAGAVASRVTTWGSGAGHQAEVRQGASCSLYMHVSLGCLWEGQGGTDFFLLYGDREFLIPP